jgi:hypothetical protein
MGCEKCLLENFPNKDVSTVVPELRDYVCFLKRKCKDVGCGDISTKNKPNIERTNIVVLTDR